MGIGAAIGAGAIGSAAALGSSAAIIGTGVNVGTSLFGGSQQAQGAQNATNAQMQIYNQNQQLLNPYVQGGLGAYNTLNGLLGVGGNTASMQSALENLPGYQFTLGQGLKSVQNGMAARGLADSSRILPIPAMALAQRLRALVLRLGRMFPAAFRRKEMPWLLARWEQATRSIMASARRRCLTI